MVRRSDGVPCRDHPLDQGKSDQSAGRSPGSRVTAWCTPSQAPHDLASGPVAVPRAIAQEPVHRAHRLQLQGQPRIWVAPAFTGFIRTAFPN